MSGPQTHSPVKKQGPTFVIKSTGIIRGQSYVGVCIFHLLLQMISKKVKFSWGSRDFDVCQHKTHPSS